MGVEIEVVEEVEDGPEGLAGVGVPVELRGGRSWAPGPQQGDVVPDEQHGQPLPQVPPHHPQLAISGPGELKGEAPDSLQGQLVPSA